MKVIIALALALAAPAFADEKIIPIGDWAGIGQQGGGSWAMEVHIAQGGARVDYPSLECGGIWVFDPEYPAIRGTEWLTYGHANCLDALGFTLMTGPDGQLVVRWYDDAGAEIAFGELRGGAPESAEKKTGSGRKN